MSVDEDIARRFEKRNGFELIDYAPVALPLFRLTIDTVTMVHHEIPPIKQFVMRSVKSGLTHREEIAGFLGLDSTVVSATVDQLLSDRYATDPEDGGVALTQRGQDVLSKAQEFSPRDEMQVLLYDRLLRKPVRLTADQVLAPIFVDPQRVIEIRPYPAEGPEVEDLSMPDVSRLGTASGRPLRIWPRPSPDQEDRAPSSTFSSSSSAGVQKVAIVGHPRRLHRR